MPQQLGAFLKRPKEPVCLRARQGVAGIAVLRPQVGVWIVLAAALALPLPARSQADSPGSFDALVSAAAGARDAQDFPKAIQLTEQALKLQADRKSVV